MNQRLNGRLMPICIGISEGGSIFRNKLFLNVNIKGVMT